LYRPVDEDTVNTLNINADTVAGEIAAVIGAERLVFLTDVDGVRDKEGKLLTALYTAEAEILVKDGIASGGMIPKLDACLRSLQCGATAHIIDGRKAHALIGLLDIRCEGTTIKAGG
jgi:acetylglutamate kinase